VDSSFERFCLTAGMGALEQMLCADARRLAGPRHSRTRALGTAGARLRDRSAFTAARLSCACGYRKLDSLETQSRADKGEPCGGDCTRTETAELT
jgi:cobalamin biosynthesis protein CobD/CbiB